MSFFIVCFVVIGIIILIVELLKSDSPHYVNLKIATFNGSNKIENLEVTTTGFRASIKNDIINYKTTENGRSIGELQYNISMTFKRWAEIELNRNFYINEKGWEVFKMSLTYKGSVVTESEWPKVTNSNMRSTKNPIARIDRVKNGPPMGGYSEHIIRKKI